MPATSTKSKATQTHALIRMSMGLNLFENILFISFDDIYLVDLKISHLSVHSVKWHFTSKDISKYQSHKVRRYSCVRFEVNIIHVLTVRIVTKIRSNSQIVWSLSWRIRGKHFYYARVINAWLWYNAHAVKLFKITVQNIDYSFHLTFSSKTIDFHLRAHFLSSREGFSLGIAIFPIRLQRLNYSQPLLNISRKKDSLRCYQCHNSIRIKRCRSIKMIN